MLTHPQRVLEGARGDIQNDGYAGINPLFVGPDARRRIGCNDHGRRRFVQSLEQGDRRAQPMIDLYSALYHVERTATERNLDATGRRALRQAESVPLWRERELERAIIDITPKVDKKARLGKAIHYRTRQQPFLRAFLDDGRFPISNAHVERLLRVVATFRKNSRFVGSLDAGRGTPGFGRQWPRNRCPRRPPAEVESRRQRSERIERPIVGPLGPLGPLGREGGTAALAATAARLRRCMRRC